MLTITNPPMRETDPHVIRRISKPGEPYDSEVIKLTGEYSRVSIKTAADWNLIRMMQHGVDFHAPASGDGIMVKTHLLKQ